MEISKKSEQPTLVKHTADRSSIKQLKFVGMGVLHVRKSNIIVSVNETALTFLGYPKGFQLQEKGFLEICPTMSDHDWERLILLAEGNGACEFDTVFLTHSGSFLQLRCVVVCEVGASVVDVYLSSGEQNSELLNSAFRKLKFCESFVETELMDINLKNTDLEYVATSRMFEKTFSLEAGGAIGKTPHDIYPPAFADHVASHDRTVLDRKQVITQIDVVPYTGKHLLVQKFPIFNGSSLSGIGVIAVDVTSLKDSEKRLLESKNKFSDYVDLCDDILWETDHNWIIRESNVSGASSVSGIVLRVGDNIINEIRQQLIEPGALDEFIGALQHDEISKEIFELRNGTRLKLGIKSSRVDAESAKGDKNKVIYRGILKFIKTF